VTAGNREAMTHELARPSIPDGEVTPAAMRLARPRRTLSELVRRTKGTLRATDRLRPGAEAAVKPQAQRWSVAQPHCVEMVRALRGRSGHADQDWPSASLRRVKRAMRLR
jgi:hypothetical protein